MFCEKKKSIDLDGSTMILLKNLEVVLADNKTLPLEKGGELESYIARPLPQILLENFGIRCEIEIKKE